MNKQHLDASVRAALLEADLLELELQVAHRADELWQEGGADRGSDLAYWMRAEREVIERRFRRRQNPVPI